MNEKKHDSLEKLATEMVDSLNVDWNKADALSEADQSLLKNLNTISQVAQLHRSQSRASKKHTSHKTSEPLLFQWGRLAVREKIGEGAFGEVYCAYDELLDREVALKLLKNESQSPLKSKAFIEEAQRLAKVRHPNVLAIHGANIHDGRAGFWADLIKGQSLDCSFENQVLGFDELLKITQQVTQGLNAIHHAGLIHGDIKPANVIQDERGDFLIMDFGAGMAFEELTSLPGYIHGTPALMAPELFKEQHEGTATDVYALGATLFKLATDQYPISGDDVLAIQQAHKTTSYKNLKSLRPDLPNAFCQLVQSLINSNAKKRPTTQEIIKALYEIETAPQRRRNKIAIWSIIALLVLGTVVSTFGFYQANQAKEVALNAQNKAETVNAFLQEMLEASAELGKGMDVRIADVLDRASDQLLADPPDDDYIELEMHQSLAHSYNALHNTVKSLLHSEKAVLLASNLYQPGEETLVRSQLELSKALQLDEQHQKSIDLVSQIIEQAEPVLGSNHWYVQISRKLLINNLFSLGSYDEAINILETHFQEIPKPETAVNNFGFEILHAKANALNVKGHFKQAIEAAEKAIAWLEAYPNENLLNMENAKTVLGLALLESGQIDKGVKILEEVLALNEQIYGVENEEYIDALVNLGAAQRLQKKPELAKQTTLQAFELAKIAFGEKPNMITIGIGTNLANMLVDLGDVEQGEAVMRETLEISYQVLGSEKPQSLIIEYNLAELLNNQGRYSEALENAISTYSKKINTFGAQHPFVFLSLDNWAISLRGLQQYNEALERHQAAVDGMVAAVGTKHPYALLVRQHQLDTLIAAGRLQENIERLTVLVQDLTETLGADDAATQRFQQILNNQ